MPNANPKLPDTVSKFYRSFLSKIPMLILTLLTVAVLLLCWSSNYYLKELIVIELKNQTKDVDKTAVIYDKVIKFNIDSQIYKERMYAHLNELNTLLIQWRTLASTNNLIVKNDKETIEAKNKRSLEQIAKLDDLVQSIRKDLNDLNRALTVFTDNGVPNEQK